MGQEIYNSFPPSVLDPLVQGVPEKLELGKEAVKQVNIIKFPKGGLGTNNYLMIANNYLLRAALESSQPQSFCPERWPAVGSLPSLRPSLALEVEKLSL